MKKLENHKRSINTARASKETSKKKQEPTTTIIAAIVGIAAYQLHPRKLSLNIRTLTIFQMIVTGRTSRNMVAIFG